MGGTAKAVVETVMDLHLMIKSNLRKFASGVRPRMKAETLAGSLFLLETKRILHLLFLTNEIISNLAGSKTRRKTVSTKYCVGM